MTTDDHHDDHLGDDVVPLALGEVTGARRSALAAHLLACPACRAEYDEVAAALQGLLTAVPPVQPPPGFEARALARIGASASTAAGDPAHPAGPARPAGLGPDLAEAAGRGPVPAAQPVPARRRWPALLAAAALVVVLAVGAALALRSSGDATDAPRLAVVETTTGGRPVGTASVARVDGEDVLVVGLTAAPAEATYTCRMRFADGSTVDTEPWDARPGAGWTVPLPDGRGDLTGIELVAPDTGAVWSTADLAS